ncbi:MAG: SRPBCC domain-containing protein [Cyclobacteriaceae bacterium]
MTIITASLSAQDGKASTIKKTFSRETAVSIGINASPEVIWALLTNASDFSRWNSTIVYIKGEIKVKEKIQLKSVLDDKRVFKIGIKEMVPTTRMVWGDGAGTRVFTLDQKSDGQVVFSMREKMGGLMFPMYASKIPPFDENFEQFAADLKKEAELIEKG